MPKRERPLEPGDDVVVQFARDLRLLRQKAGAPTYRELSARAHYSAAALSEAASGRKLPTLPVTLAYVAGCGGDTTEWEARWRTTAAELTASQAATPKADDNGRAPYVGLAAFQQEDTDRFFGRDTLVTELLTRLQQHRFLGVFGASGCGKSSLLRAGMAAHLTAVREQDRLPVVVFTPGQHPIEECAIHLARFLGESPGTLREELTADPRNLHLRIRQATAAGGAAANDVVLVVDQFEELFTLCGDEHEQAGFVDALVFAATDPESRAKVAIGVRADFLGHCGEYPRLVSALRDTQVLVGPMTTAELRLAITGPAEQAGYRVETALVARLVADASRQSGMLPLVAHALLQTWQRRQGKVMTLAGYETVGGIEHALVRTAEQTYQALDADQRDLAQQIFLRLTALGEGTEDTKRRIRRDELDHSNPNTAQVLDTLTRARLITVGHNSVEIAHEALIRHWPRLRDWLTDDRDGLRLHRQLTNAITEWNHHHRDESLLYRGARLTAWQDRPLDRLNDTELAFLTASRDVEEREHRSRRRRIRRTIGGLSTATVVVAVLAIIALVLAGQADHERAVAVSRQLVADIRVQLEVNPELALLLAREAYTRTPNSDTEALLRQTFADSHTRATFSADRFTVTGIMFSPDGSHLAASTADRKLRVWGWDGHQITGTRPRVLNWLGTSGPMYSSDGRGLAATTTVGDGITVREWSSDREPVVLPGHKGATKFAFSADGQYVASSGNWTDIYISNVAGDAEPKVLAPQDNVLKLSFSPDGRLLASAGESGAVRIWDLVGGGAPTVLDEHEGPVFDVTFSSDGHHLTTAGEDGTIRIWDATGGSDSDLLGRHGSSATSVAYSADGHWVASAGVDRTVRVWNADHPAEPVILRGHDEVVNAVAFSPDGNSVASGSIDGTVKIWDVNETEDPTVLRGHQGRVRSVAVNSSERWVASGGQDGTIRIWGLGDTDDPLVLPRQSQPVTQVAFSTKRRYVASFNGLAQCVWTAKHSGPESPPPDCREIQTPTGQVAFSPDGNRFAAPNMAGTIGLWNTGETSNPTILPGKRLDGTTAVAWSPTGQHIAVSTGDGSVLLWDLRTHAGPTRLPGHVDDIQSLAFNPGGTRLASGSNDGTIHLWHITSTTPPTVLTGHQGRVWSMTFSRDGRNLITSSDDTTIRIWKIDSTSAPLVLDGFRATTQDIAALPDGSYTSAHDDGTVRIWRCRACGPITEILPHVNQHVTRQLTPQERRTYLSDS